MRKIIIQDFLKMFCFLCLPISLAYQKIINDVQDKTLTNCVAKIVQEWTFNTSVLDLNLMNADDEIDIAALHKIEGLRFIAREFSWSTYRLYNNAYIIEIQSYLDLKEGLSKAITDRLWNPKAKFIIVFKNLSAFDLLDIRNLLFHYNLYDITVLISENENYAIYKFNTTENSYCSRTENLVLISLCSEYINTTNSQDLVRSDSIQNCHFNFITHKIWPFINFDGTNVQGVEQRIIREFEKYEGLKIELHLLLKHKDKYGDIIPNYIDSMLKQVESNEFEGTVGGFTNFLNNTENFSYTYPVMVGRKLFVLARADRLGPWEGVLSRFSRSLIPVGVVFISLCVAARLFSIFPTQERNITRDIILILGYILNKTVVNNINPKLPQRIVFFGLLWLALFVPYVTQGHLYSSIRSPVRGYEPKTTNELSGYTPIFYSEFANRDTLTGKNCGSRLNCLLDVKNSETKKLFTIVSYAHYIAYKSKLIDDRCHLKVYALEENHNIELRMIFLRRGSVLLDRFNKILFRMSAAGLIRKYFNDIMHFEDLKCKLGSQKYNNPLNIGDTFGFLTILAAGYMISIIVFSCEVILGRKKT